MSFVPPEQVRSLANLSASFDEARLTYLIDVAIGAAERYVRRPLQQTTATEYYDGTGNDVINLKRWPVTAVSDVRMDRNGGGGQFANTFGTDTQLDATRDYSFDSPSGRLVKAGFSAAALPGMFGGRSLMARTGLWAGVVTGGGGYASWPVGRQNVMVTYTGGYEVAPMAIVGAIAELVMYQYRAIPTGGRLGQSESFLDTSVSYAAGTLAVSVGTAPLLQSARGVLDSYREIPLAGNAR